MDDAKGVTGEKLYIFPKIQLTYAVSGGSAIPSKRVNESA